MTSTTMASWARTRLVGLASAALCAVLLAGGCSDGVELNGKIFDALGVSSAAQAAKSAEPKVAARPGLVLPPDPSRLPVPGSVPDEGQSAIATVVDPETKKAQALAERARLHKAYCSGELRWKERAFDRDYIPTSPYGPCGLIDSTVKAQAPQ